MHMPDALLSPTVGGAMWIGAAAAGARCVRVVQRDPDDRRVPLMGVLGAFVFSIQMISFSIPGTGSSSHLGGGMLLAVLLGPHAAFLVMASVLAIQALFFADGGLLALGSNVINLGFFTSFVAYPLVFRRIAGPCLSHTRVLAGAVAASAVGLALGAGGVVVETLLSGLSSLPVRPFLLLMIPVHLAVGVVEGLVTASIALVLWRARPELLRAHEITRRRLRSVFGTIVAVSLVTGGLVSLLASQRPDLLESQWSASGDRAPDAEVHAWLARLQESTALLPGYGFRRRRSDASHPPAPGSAGGTSLSGVVGSALTLGAAALIGAAVRRIRRR